MAYEQRPEMLVADVSCRNVEPKLVRLEPTAVPERHLGVELGAPLVVCHPWRMPEGSGGGERRVTAAGPGSELRASEKLLASPKCQPLITAKSIRHERRVPRRDSTGTPNQS